MADGKPGWMVGRLKRKADISGQVRIDMGAQDEGRPGWDAGQWDWVSDKVACESLLLRHMGYIAHTGPQPVILISRYCFWRCLTPTRAPTLGAFSIYAKTGWSAPDYVARSSDSVKPPG